MFREKVTQSWKLDRSLSFKKDGWPNPSILKLKLRSSFLLLNCSEFHIPDCKTSFGKFSFEFNPLALYNETSII